MKTLLTIAWRNIWRHPARSGVLIAAVVAGLWAGVVTVGVLNGMMDQRLNNLIESELTHIQVHHPEFLDEGYSRLFIEEVDDIAAFLNQDERVKSFTKRTITDGMLQSPVKTSGVRIRGIDTGSETRTTNFHTNMVEGEYLDSSIPNAVIIGRTMANEHNMELGHRVVLTFEDVSNQLTSSAFNIVGIFESAGTDFDRRNVFVRSSDISSILSDKAIFHEIAIMLHDEPYAQSLAADINQNFSGITAQTWRELSPELNLIVEFGEVMLYIIMLIIMAALAFGILNTMLMALFERMREIGMLISIGMSRTRVFLMIMLEAIVLTLTGAAAGILLAIFSIRYLSSAGVNLERFAAGIAELGWDHMIYPIMSTPEYVAVVIMVIVITLLASLYPAAKAIRINPLEAAKDS